MQQLLLQCALRPERVTQFASVYTARVLEQKLMRYTIYIYIHIYIYKLIKNQGDRVS